MALKIPHTKINLDLGDNHRSHTFYDGHLTFALRGRLWSDGSIYPFDVANYLRTRHQFFLDRRDIVYVGDGYIRIEWEASDWR